MTQVHFFSTPTLWSRAHCSINCLRKMVASNSNKFWPSRSFWEYYILLRRAWTMFLRRLLASPWCCCNSNETKHSKKGSKIGKKCNFGGRRLFNFSQKKCVSIDSEEKDPKIANLYIFENLKPDPGYHLLFQNPTRVCNYYWAAIFSWAIFSNFRPVLCMHWHSCPKMPKSWDKISLNWRGLPVPK